jgi:hypothetical protein
LFFFFGDFPKTRENLLPFYLDAMLAISAFLETSLPELLESDPPGLHMRAVPGVGGQGTVQRDGGLA